MARRWSARTWPDAIETWLERERDQLALWLPVALGSGIAAWFTLPDRNAWIAFLALALGGAALATVFDRGGRLARALALFLMGAALGCGLAWARSNNVAASALTRPTVMEVAGTIEAVDRLPARGIVRLLIAPDAGLLKRVRVNLDEKDGRPALTPGASVTLRARLMPPAPPALPGAYDFARVAWFQGIGATGKALGPVTVVKPAAAGGGWARMLAAWRARLTAHIETRLAGSTGGIAAAFVTGDVGAIDDADSDAMRNAGLAHLLSISGLHVTAVVAGTMLLTLRLLALSPWLALRAPLLVIAAGAGAAAGIAYTLLSGAQVPTVRSCVAALLVLTGIAMGREAMTLRLVATGALIVMLFRPEAVVGPSFQLSFAAVTAIIAFHEHPWVRSRALKREEGLPRRAVRELATLLVTGLLVEAALMPIAAYHFHRASIYGAAANIVAIPLTTFVIMPLEAVALALDTCGLGTPIWWLAGQGLGLLLWMARTVSSAPGAVAALPSMPLGAFVAMVGGGIWLALWRTRLRWLGGVPLIFGAIWALATPAPDLLVTGDGKHLAIRSARGDLYLLRPHAGDYVRQQLGEGSGVQDEALDLDALPGARCNADLCAADVVRGGRIWRVLATRSAYTVDIGLLMRACAAADIVVSDRRLPRTCHPHWIKADRQLLARTGGLAISLRRPDVRVVRDADRHPWALPGPLQARPMLAAQRAPELPSAPCDRPCAPVRPAAGTVRN